VNVTGYLALSSTIYNDSTNSGVRHLASHMMLTPLG
jgi:hypothetical protein